MRWYFWMAAPPGCAGAAVMPSPGHGPGDPCGPQKPRHRGRRRRR